MFRHIARTLVVAISIFSVTSLVGCGSGSPAGSPAAPHSSSSAGAFSGSYTMTLTFGRDDIPTPVLGASGPGLHNAFPATVTTGASAITVDGGDYWGPVTLQQTSNGWLDTEPAESHCDGPAGSGDAVELIYDVSLRVIASSRGRITEAKGAETWTVGAAACGIPAAAKKVINIELSAR